MQEFKIRCSQIGQIMTNDRSGKTIGKTSETYVKNWVKSQFFNRKIEIKSKYITKGNQCENDSIEMISKHLGLDLSKNQQHFENEFMTGTPDIITDSVVIDVKNSWDWSTFPLLENEIPDILYFYQLQGYMKLTGVKSAKLIYVLSDTPEELIEKEAWYHCKELGLMELDFSIFEEFKEKMTYSDIPVEKRIKVFSFDYDETVIDAIEKRVIECRNIADNLFKLI